jgi:hypothetical protein
MLGPDDLLVTAPTLGHPPFRSLLEAAAAGGFSGLSIWPVHTYQSALEAGLRPAELRRMLEDHGIEANDVDALVCTGDPSDAGAGGMGKEAEGLLFEAGGQLGARFVNVVMMSSGPLSVDQGAEVFAGVCERASKHGLTPYLEFVPFMSVPDAATCRFQKIDPRLSGSDSDRQRHRPAHEPRQRCAWAPDHAVSPPGPSSPPLPCRPSLMFHGHAPEVAGQTTRPAR